MQRILLCLDADPQPSVFDAVVAIDAGADRLLRHGGVTPDQVEALVHGAIFTRKSRDLKNTALFIGGSDLAASEAILAAASRAFFGDTRVSIFMDPNGANTTAAAAVTTAARHVALESGTTACVIGAGPVGRRIAWMLASRGVQLRVVALHLSEAEAACEDLARRMSGAESEPCGATPYGAAGGPIAAAIDGADFVIAAGSPGVEVLDEPTRSACDSLRVVIDLNAVPPAGIGGVDQRDGLAGAPAERFGQLQYGALGVGGLKLSVHKEAVRRVFSTNDAVLDGPEILKLAEAIDRKRS